MQLESTNSNILLNLNFVMGNTSSVKEGRGGRAKITSPCLDEDDDLAHKMGAVDVYADEDEGQLSHADESSEFMGSNTPPESPASFRSPLIFTAQVPMAPIQRRDELGLNPNHAWANNSTGSEDLYYERCIPTMVTWSYGGNEVAVKGSWDNWTSKKLLQRAGKDFTIMVVLPSGIYYYKFLVDGEWRHVPDLPCVCDEMGNVNNILEVQEYIPENLESVAGLEPPESPDSSYNDIQPGIEDYAKEPPGVPPQLHLTLLNSPITAEAPGIVPRPHHVVLNHLYVEKRRSTQPTLALGLTWRFRSKYVTLVIYKPMRN